MFAKSDVRDHVIQCIASRKNYRSRNRIAFHNLLRVVRKWWIDVFFFIKIFIPPSFLLLFVFVRLTAIVTWQSTKTVFFFVKPVTYILIICNNNFFYCVWKLFEWKLFFLRSICICFDKWMKWWMNLRYALRSIDCSKLSFYVEIIYVVI